MADTPEMLRIRNAAGAVRSSVVVARNVVHNVFGLAAPVDILALHARTDICCALAVHGVGRQFGLKLHPRFSGAP